MVYFQDGPDYIRFGYAPIVLQTLIDEGAIPPCLGVFITPPNLHLGKVPDRSTEYGMNTKYLAFFCDELVPFIGQLLPVRSDARSHVIVGDSYGRIGSGFIPPRDQDFTAANVRMSETLRRVGIAHRFTVTREGPTWSNWREQLVEGLTYLLADS